MESQNDAMLAQLQTQIDALQKKVTRLENARQDQLSIAVVSGDMDKILAAMVISLAAAAMDTKVKLFFSFWSLSALRDPKKTIDYPHLSYAGAATFVVDMGESAAQLFI
ncbi:MAG: hypothetical protein H6Q18_268 [Bacteroidetes bacterium]|nr:hypothetical protein [Bacteroidota bacterium]